VEMHFICGATCPSTTLRQKCCPPKEVKNASIEEVKSTSLKEVLNTSPMIFIKNNYVPGFIKKKLDKKLD
jgi:hypothetical protein